MVKSVKGADITVENVDISNCAADSVNAVWVDEDAASYAKISKITILEEPLEMTTTKKVKRNYNK